MNTMVKHKKLHKKINVLNKQYLKPMLAVLMFIIILLHQKYKYFTEFSE